MFLPARGLQLMAKSDLLLLLEGTATVGALAAEIRGMATLE